LGAREGKSGLPRGKKGKIEEKEGNTPRKFPMKASMKKASQKSWLPAGWNLGIRA
jgi:hypothetical protein